MQSVALVFFLLGLLFTGVLGTETRLLFFWPGAALLGLAGLVATLRWRLRVLFPPSDICLATSVLFTGYVASRAWLSPVAAYAREDLFILAGAWVVYMLTVTAASHPRWRVAIFAVLLTLVLGNLVVGFIHLSGNWQFHVVPFFLRSATEGRIGGFFANPNHLGAFFSMVLFLAAGFLCFGRGGAALKMCLGFLIISMMIGVALTASRGALTGLAIGAALFSLLALGIVWQTQRHLFWSLLGGGLVVSVLGGAVLWKVNEEYLRGREITSPMANDVRLEIWQAALAQHAQSPWVGAGSRMFYDGSVQYRSEKLPAYAGEALFAHNEYLQMLADYGWVGLVLLVLVIMAHAWNGLAFIGWFTRHRFLQTGRLMSNHLAFCLGALAALTAMLVHAIFEFQFHVAAPTLTAALLLGLLANPGFEGSERRSLRLPPVRLMTKILLGLASVLLITGPWFYGLSDYHVAKAQIAEAQKDAFEQSQELNAAVDKDPMNPEARYLRGLSLLGKLRADQRTPNHPVLKRATEDLAQAVKLNPHHYLYALALADAYDAQSRHQEALEQLHRALILAPLHEESRMALAVHWHRLGQFEKAEAAYLWAGEAKAMNEEGSSRWIDNYRLLLQHVALIRQSPPSN
ncbi:O-antigen ligase family protein [Prosthecobacter dejongeii]|uniref:O-antigen ligase n=1 Tax=Prosthecobacter dejongeii TaxID=48465 RepID=A0A7W7YII7_9BACT|nr:O-antigen ligase family protein [Prosthecobacter dejongeii]MBB5036856.1 O-antigen ligase [Prosthecobacter dejongeii]